ncbi:metal-dependent hydrolase [Halalkalicoccus salilacus]|uniref:metal-dependent hydrolase n=1 Tax=Halalkalicoccus salilacus TaxID=3117459 RepID=UPI00300F0112
MAELLTHVLVAYAVLTIAGWRVDWLTPRWVALGTVGALLPDLNQLGRLLSGPTIERMLGVPFAYGALHTVGGIVLLAALVALFFAQRRRAFAVLVAGGLSHLLLDALKIHADGRAGTWLYPLTWWRHPAPDLYVSADSRVLAAALVGATAVLVAGRYRTARREGSHAD